MLIYLLRFLLRNPSIEEIFLQLIINGLKKFLVSLGNIGSPIIDYEIRINTNIRMKNDVPSKCLPISRLLKRQVL